MKYALTLLSAASLATTAFAAYVPTQPWSTLTPAGTLTATSDASDKTFGIVVQTLDADYKKVKRDDTLVTQIGDGQIQYPTTTSYETAMDTPTAVYVNTQPLVTQIGDGQIQFPTGDNTQYEAPSTKLHDEVYEVGVPDFSKILSMVLEDGVLYDSQDRIGSIFSNNQFQFDDPTPQSGAVSEDGYLALGDQVEFYECLSGDFYNLYNSPIAVYCLPIQFRAIELR
ncbi:hypothetical protein CANARDRAFT_10170 [[Candida] arabinofermentans NRRL YB-2248]|uniref:Cell wall mannoprotein PIR1-like C-terminal domain-containing protein n=1 Tax=[Candida] arabinofermentans NRRL YB-2248 TaxID=983967 RepID=A0A1E4STQ1_9ASCO|nr:hypothetical protein CANARDRAFT_10170 [[Candida] arabinofermentans NRRL YB-2248]